MPTAESVLQCRQAAPETLLIASGGPHRHDAAKAFALGADVAGFAGPLLRAAAESEDACYEALRALVEELRVTMYCTGSRTLAHLRSAELTREGD
ncbi:MAG: alpha-hydroxy-acid oxidizing protein [Chloroflexia bacterium]